MSMDGTRMVGHMVLRKSIVEGNSQTTGAILGLKVTGGTLLPDGTRGAIVEKIKKGSIADIEGQLRIGNWFYVPYHNFYTYIFLIVSNDFADCIAFYFVTFDFSNTLQHS